MSTRRATIAILSAIAILIVPVEARAQTFLENVRSWFNYERHEQIDFDIQELKPINNNFTPHLAKIRNVVFEIENQQPVLNEAVLDLQSSSNSHDWATINNWLISGLPREVDPINSDININALNVDREQFLCLATNIYFEARGSTLDDQRAVALVTLNRTRHWRWRGAICDVVWERYQFSWTITANQSNNRVRTASSWLQSQQIAYEVLRGYVPDITNGSTNYYNPSVVNPPWARLAVQSQRIGAHRYLVLRTTRDYQPPAYASGLDINRVYSSAIRGILRQMLR